MVGEILMFGYNLSIPMHLYPLNTNMFIPVLNLYSPNDFIGI